jgi:hypothetical protein
MPRAKTPRTTKTKTDKKVLQMPEIPANGNGQHAVPADLESEIRARAYELYEQHGFAHGRAQEDWLQAEREVMARYASRSHTA